MWLVRLAQQLDITFRCVRPTQLAGAAAQVSTQWCISYPHELHQLLRLENRLTDVESGGTRAEVANKARRSGGELRVRVST